jgi:hypothetical protein
LSAARRLLNNNQDSLPERESAFLTGIKNKVSEPVTAAFLAGGVAGAVSRTIVSPLERLKILLQIQTVGREEYRLSIWKALVKIGKEEGWRGFMRGNGTNCIRIIPYSAVQFGSYNFYKKVSHTKSHCNSAYIAQKGTNASNSLQNLLPMQNYPQCVVSSAEARPESLRSP